MTTPSAQDLKTAAAQGRAATPGAANPYTGQGALARAWRAGYRRMLASMLDTSPAYQAYLAAKSGTPRP